MKKRGDTMSLRIDGKKISSDIKEELKEQVKLLKGRRHFCMFSCNSGRK